MSGGIELERALSERSMASSSASSISSTESENGNATREPDKKIDDSFYFQDAYFEVSIITHFFSNESTLLNMLSLCLMLMRHTAGTGHDFQSSQTRIRNQLIYLQRRVCGDKGRHC